MDCTLPFQNLLFGHVRSGQRRPRVPLCQRPFPSGDGSDGRVADCGFAEHGMQFGMRPEERSELVGKLGQLETLWVEIAGHHKRWDSAD